LDTANTQKHDRKAAIKNISREADMTIVIELRSGTWSESARER
jgi:1,2-phenylacetyl-CoA epoxidase catalytic subunit